MQVTIVKRYFSRDLLRCVASLPIGQYQVILPHDRFMHVCELPRVIT